MTADSASFHSLNVIRDELVATIEQAARDLELFVSEEGDSRSFQSCLAGIKQINGILRLLEFKGASMLAEELLLTASTLDKTGRGPLFEKQLELVSTTFFVLSRYLEYVQQTERKIPVLLIPYINDLRKFRREPVLPESFFFPVDIKSCWCVCAICINSDCWGYCAAAKSKRLLDSCAARLSACSGWDTTSPCRRSGGCPISPWMP
jgi:hypothetical protein